MTVKHTERSMLDLLHKRYNTIVSGARRYVIAEQPCVGGYSGRRADAIVMDTWASGGYDYHGFEIKVSRSDWLHELKDLSKSHAFKRYMDRWWLVIPTVDIVKPGELPNDWGHLVASGHHCLNVKIKAPKLAPEDIPRRVQTFITRAVSVTTARQITRHPENYITYYNHPDFTELKDLAFMKRLPAALQEAPL